VQRHLLHCFQVLPLLVQNMLLRFDVVHLPRELSIVSKFVVQSMVMVVSERRGIVVFLWGFMLRNRLRFEGTARRVLQTVLLLLLLTELKLMPMLKLLLRLRRHRVLLQRKVLREMLNATCLRIWIWLVMFEAVPW
jgi:hypothetical protein